MSAWYEHPLHYWRAGGPLLIPLAAVCFGIWYLFLRSRDTLMRAADDVSHVENALRDRDLDRLRHLAGTTAACVKQILTHWHSGHDAGVAFDEESSRFMDQFKRNLVILVALTAVAPLLGLLGTVVGMIDTFDAVAATSGETATRVASGVSRALITTQVGLVVAIPGFFGLARLRRLLHHLEVQYGAIKLHLIQFGERI